MPNTLDLEEILLDELYHVRVRMAFLRAYPYMEDAGEADALSDRYYAIMDELEAL